MPKDEHGLVHGYTRVSDDCQLAAKDKVGSLDRQTEVVAQKAHGLVAEIPSLSVGRLFREEAVSAWKMPLCERPKGNKLNEILASGDHVVFPTLDRGWRKIRDCMNTLEMWWDRGITVHILSAPFDTSTAAGRAMLHMSAVMAEMESGIKSERSKSKSDHSLLNNASVGKRPPIGKRWIAMRNGQRELVDDPLGLELFQCMRMWRITEGIGERSAANRCAAFIKWWFHDHEPDATSDDIADAIEYHANRSQTRTVIVIVERLEELVRNGAQLNATHLRLRHPQAERFQSRSVRGARREVRQQSEPARPHAPESIWGVPRNGGA